MCGWNCSSVVKTWIDSDTGKRKTETADGRVWTDHDGKVEFGKSYIIGEQHFGKICERGRVELSTPVFYTFAV